MVRELSEVWNFESPKLDLTQEKALSTDGKALNLA